MRERTHPRLKVYDLHFRGDDLSEWQIECELSADFVIRVLSDVVERAQGAEELVKSSDLLKDFFYLLSLDQLLRNSPNPDKYLERGI